MRKLMLKGLLVITVITLCSCTTIKENKTNDNPQIEQEKIEEEEQEETKKKEEEFFYFAKTTTDVNVRKTPFISDSNKITVVSKGTIFELLEEINGEWTRVKVDNEIAYIASEYLENTSILKYHIETFKKQYIVAESELEYILSTGVKVPKYNFLDTYPVDKLIFEKKSEFSTHFEDVESGRRNNLIVASETINGTIILPGEEFIWSEVVGSTTREKGYAEANIYVGQEVTKGLGGGVCQISTTLYNTAVKLNGMTITERHQHSMPVSYVESGMDATVADGLLDFRFRNDLDDPIKIVGFIENGTVTMEIHVGHL